MHNKPRLGELLIDAGLITADDLHRALRMQVGGNRRLGRILVQMGAITSDQLLDTVAAQFDLPIIDIDQEIQPAARGLLPRYLCRKYEALPLGLDGDRVLRVAMADPSDTEALNDIEHYTGKAVQPCLARQADIRRAIGRHAPFTVRDLFSPQVSSRSFRVAGLAALVLVMAVAVFAYRMHTLATYGRITRTATEVLYKNHDLMVGIEQGGKTTLLGRGAHASGYYAISFDSPAALAKFAEQKKTDLSSEQYEWLQWALAQER